MLGLFPWQPKSYRFLFNRFIIVGHNGWSGQRQRVEPDEGLQRRTQLLESPLRVVLEMEN